MYPTSRRMLFPLLLLTVILPAIAGEGRIPIWEPTTITEPGRYILTRSIVALPGQSSIVIDASGVDFDLNGFTIFGSNVQAIRSIGQHSISIRNGIIEGGMMGITIEDARDVVIEGLSVKSLDKAAVYLTPIGSYRIAGNTLDDLGDLDNFAIIVETPLGGREGGGRIENNHIRMVSGGIRVVGGGSDVVRDNRIVYTTLMEGILVENCDACAISRNEISYFETFGMRLQGCEGCRVDANVLVAPEGLDGIVLENCLGNLVERNTAANCRNGIRAVGTTLSHFERNLLSSNLGFGLWFDVAARDNTLGRNTSRGNAGAACSAPPGPQNTPDFCDEGVNNSSFGDNFMPVSY